MDLTTLDQIQQFEQGSLAIDPLSLYQAFEQVKDGRKAKGKRYPLALILTLTLLGKMAGEKTIEGIIDWLELRKKELKVLLNWPKSFPSHKTYKNALAHCNDQEVVNVIAQAILKARAQEQCGEEPSRLVPYIPNNGENLIHTPVDGKVMRGTLKHEREDQPPVHLVTFYEEASGLVLDQLSVSSKENEYSATFAILSPTLAKGRILTTDAMFSNRPWCAAVNAYGGYYVTPITDNNPAVLGDLVLFFADDGIDRSEFQYDYKVDKGHGRLEKREIWTSTQMNEWFAKEWAGIAQVFMLKRTVIEKGETRIEIVYGITNLPRKKADATRLLKLNRKHWSIENRLHYRRDVTLGEDSSQVRCKGVPEVLAALNGGILALMDFFHVQNVAKQMRVFCAKPLEALQWLLGKLSRSNR